MNIGLFFIVVLILGVAYGWIGLRVSRGLSQSSDYFLASRSLGLFSLSLSIMATQLGGGVVLGAADEAFRVGWTALFWPAGIAAGLLALGLGLGRRLRRFGVSTVAELFDTVYQSRGLRSAAAGLSVLSLFLLLVAQLVACRKLLYAFGLESEVLFLAIWLGVLLYTVLGGLRAVVYTDVLQTLFLLVVFSLAFFSASRLGGSCDSETNFAPLSGGGGLFCSLFLLPFLFMVIGQDMGQRCFAARSDRSVTLAFLIAVVGFCIVGAIPVAFGVWARQAGLQVAASESVLMVASGSLTGTVVATLIACGVLVAILSTVDSLLCAVGSNLGGDFMSKLGLRACQLLTLGVGLLALVLSLTVGSVGAVTMQAYELSVSCLAVPVLLAIVRGKGERAAGFGGVIGGALGFALFRLWGLPVPREAASLLLSLAGYCVGVVWVRYALYQPFASYRKVQTSSTEETLR